MELNLELLAIQNPWWGGENLKFDPAIEQYNRQALKWRPEILDEIDLAKDKIYFLAGLKGVGKTTAMKLIVKKLIEEEKIRPNSLFFYSCHNLDSYEQLNEMIKLFLNWSGAQKRRKYIFIDEIALVKNWQKGIEYLRQAGAFKGVTVILSGSSGIGASAPSGIVFQPMTGLSFKEFMSLINPALMAKIKRADYKNWHDKLDYYLDIYLLTGGNIGAINDFKENGAVRQSVYSNFLHWFLAYVGRAGRDTALVRQILEKIILNLGRPIGFKTLASKTKAKTHLTAAEYLGLLENMFVAKTVYQSAGSRQAKKIYFTDPFMFWLFYSYVHGALDYWRFSRERLHDGEVFSALVENIILSQLLKDKKNKISYWRDSLKKQEINFMVERGGKTTPILIRFNQEIKPAELKQGIIISRDKLETKGAVKIMPLTYFLLFGEEFI